jgi:hypothetical protein
MGKAVLPLKGEVFNSLIEKNGSCFWSVSQNVAKL